MAKARSPLDFLKEDRADGSPRIFQVHFLEDFISIATWLYTSEHVVFRGQRCDWPLVPAIGRVSRRKKWNDTEREVIDEFRREAVPYVAITPKTEWQWLAVAQHNRLPTRLLDWSKNPLVALWFAVCEPAQEGKPGIVWAHSYKPKEAIYDTEGLGSPFSLDRTSVYFPEHVFPYIQAQLGVFTIHHRCVENDLFVPFQETKYAGLTKIEIVADSFPTLRHQLFRLGISPSSLFPGLSGLVNRIKYQNELLEDEPSLDELWPPARA